MGNPRHFNPEGTDQPRKIHRRCLSFNIGIGGEDQLLHLVVTQTFQKLGNIDIIRPDSLHRGDGAVQHVVITVEFLGALHGHQVLGFLDHTNH
ncbi:hypothetical protein D3C75_1128350 [compost metagenome]